MALYINTNISSLQAQRYLAQNTLAVNKYMEQLSSGYRINHAGDDAAGLTISEGLQTQINGSQQASQNVQDGMNVLNIADGAYQVIENNIQRIRELTVQAGSDTNGTSQRTAINNEINVLRADIDRIANATQFNGINLIGSTTTLTSFVLQVGPNAPAATNTINIFSALGDGSTDAGGLNLGAAAIVDNTSAMAYLGTIDTALSALNAKRATLGALSNQLQSASQFLSIDIQNLTASNARIQDVDVAAASAELTQNQILQQASASILAQANQAPQIALQLLKNL